MPSCARYGVLGGEKMWCLAAALRALLDTTFFALPKPHRSLARHIFTFFALLRLLRAVAELRVLGINAGPHWAR